MLGLIAALAYFSFVLVTAALVWAVWEITETAGEDGEWEPGANPHGWRF
jgi:hypothetical protein